MSNIRILLPNGTYQTYAGKEDEKICEFLASLEKPIFEKTEVLILPEFPFPGMSCGDGRKFVFFENGRYADEKHPDYLSGSGKRIKCEGCMVITAWQYNIPVGENVYWIPEDISGKVETRTLTEIGVKYQIRDDQGVLHGTKNGNSDDAESIYDSALEPVYE